MDALDQMNLHQLMEERLEKILIDLNKPKKKGKVQAIRNIVPANREHAEWNLSEIPILFGA